MGLESRDYARDGSYTASLSSWGMDLTPVVKYLVIANVAVFLLQMLLTRPAQFPPPDPDDVAAAREEAESDAPARPGEAKAPRDRDLEVRQARELERIAAMMHGQRTSLIQRWFELDPRKTVEQAQVWRLLTSAFCHDRYNLWHILFNMLILCWFGQRLERMYGSREFLLFYLAAAICASLAYVALAYYTGSYVPAIGASGAIMGVMMLYVIFHPFEQFLLFWVFPVPLWALLGIYMLYDLHPVLLALSGDPMFTGVAHASHLGGLAFGFAYWRFGWRLEPLVDRVAPAARRRAGRPYRAPVILSFPARDEDLSERVDEILRKISEQGKESLSDDEREVLNRASARYRRDR